MTSPGREALLEAMRIEQAKIYGHLCQEHMPSKSPSTNEAFSGRGTTRVTDIRVARNKKRGAA